MAENYGSLEGVLDANETLEGEIDSHDEMSGEIQFAGGVGGVKDVQVNNESVVDANKVAHIDLTPYAEKEDVYDKDAVDTLLEGKADTDDIPTDLSDLQDDTDHRLVTDTEKSTWNGKSDFSGSYNDLTDKPTIPDAQIQSDWEQSDDTKVDFIKNKPTIPSAQVNSDWNANSGVAQILNKPTLGTASALDVAISGDASITQVVKGDDSRLTDSRNAADVYSWAKASTKPSYTASEVGAIPSTDKGANGGVAELDSNGKVPSSQLPSYVDDVIEGYYDSTTDRFYEESTFEHVITPESGKSWVDVATNKSYRWTGSVYTRVDEGVQLGETSSTAYRGDRGKTAYDHSQLTSGNPHNVSKSDVGLGNVDNTSDSTKKTNFTGSIASGNTGFTTGGDVYTALGNKVDKVTGKQLSTEDYTTAEKTKLSGISANANKTESSTTNGNIKIDNVETPVYRNYANNTVLSTDKTPYLNRQCLTPTGFSSYVREKLIGCSVAWNQLVQNGDFSNGTTGWTTSGSSTVTVSSGIATFTAVAQNNSLYQSNRSLISGHKYLAVAQIKLTSATDKVALRLQGNNLVYTNANTSWQTLIAIYSCGTTESTVINVIDTRASGWDAIQTKNIQLIDLTLAFGSTVADTLYAMTNNGGIDWLRNHNYPIDQYTQYGYGLYSSKPSAKKVVGKNLIDESTYQLGDAAHGSMSTAFSQSDNRPYLKAGTQFVLSSNGVGAGNAWISVSTKPNSSDISEFISIDFISGRGFSNGNPIIGTMPVSGYLAFSIQNIYGNLENAKALKLQLEVGSTNTTYEPYIGVTYSLGSTELRGHLIVQNGEIVAEGDVRESNGNTKRYYKLIDLGSVEWTYLGSGGNERFLSQSAISDIKAPSNNEVPKAVCANYTVMAYTPAFSTNKSFAIYSDGKLFVKDSAYTDATTFKTAMNGVYAVYELATPTTETSSPFADPMSLNGCTTEEYVDDRTIPVPVGHETQYMGQSEDIVEIPSSPLSDGKRVLVAETSGGNTQYYFEDDKNGAGTQVNLMTYDTSSNKYVFPSDGYITLSNAGATVGDYIILSVFGANDNTICGLRCDTPIASMVTVQNLFVKRGMKCYIRAKSTGSFSALFTPLS